MSVTNVSQCQVNDFGSDHDKLKIYWITGQSTTLLDHTTEVRISCFVPATSVTPLGPHVVGIDASNNFLPVPPFLMNEPCQGSGNPIPSKLLIRHVFHSNSGGPDQSIDEVHDFDVTCPPRGCDVLFFAKRNQKKDKSKKKSSKKKQR